jgi:hypothetical protein
MFVLFLIRCCFFFAAVNSKMAQERIINRNPYLYGPGPVRRIAPKGLVTMYSRMPPVRGFSLAAAHGVVLGLLGGFAFKIMVSDPQIKAIESYYKENPPR